MGGESSKSQHEFKVKKNGLKRALLVGCNYPKTKAELSGCVNDVESWQELLIKYLGFQPENITILVDDGPEGYEPPTGKNIKDELRHLVEVSKRDDIIFFHFSGHGVQVPADEGGDYEEDGLDEALCPTDLNLIIDDDLRDILSDLDPGVKFTMVSDCCHSGGMLDHEEIVIEGDADHPSSRNLNFERQATRGDIQDLNKLKDSCVDQRNRSIDVETISEILRDSVLKDKTESAKLKPTHTFREDLFKAYGEEASHAALAMKTRDFKLQKANRIHYSGPGKKPKDFINDPNKGILITGCQSSETSADVTDDSGRSFGALSHLVTKAIKRHKRKHGDKPITNREIVLAVRKMLQVSGFAQNPCLECSQKNADENFVLW